MRRVTKENLIAQIDRLYKIKDEQGQLSMNGEYTLQAYKMLLATMEAEPVIVVGDDGGDALSYRRLIQSFEPGTKLYRHAQPAPVVQPVMFIDGDTSTEDADKLAKVIREFNEEDERPLAKMARIIRENPHPINECGMPKAQKKPVVPEEAYSDDCPELYPSQPDAWAGGWNACRAAMLNRK